MGSLMRRARWKLQGGSVRWHSDRLRQRAGKMVEQEFKDLLDVKELNKKAKTSGWIGTQAAQEFPRIKATSLSTKRIVIQDEARNADVTMVNVSFRMSGANQNKMWMDRFEPRYEDDARVKVMYLTVNESFMFKALSGFIQSSQRRRIPLRQHDSHVAFNSSGDEILQLVRSSNRVIGYQMLLDHASRVRWYGYGVPDEASVKDMFNTTDRVLAEAASGSRAINS